MNTLEVAKRHLLAVDPILGRVIERLDELPPFTPHTNYYQALVSSIIGQQLSVKAAATIRQRFIDLFGGTFPSPDAILKKDDEALRSVGLSRPKIGYIKDLALHIQNGSIDFSAFDSLPNQTIINELTQVKGVGVWTVHMFLMFCMGRLDILPSGDLGIRNGIKKLYNLEMPPSPDDVVTLAKNRSWAPYESVASWYIWQSLDNAPK